MIDMKDGGITDAPKNDPKPCLDIAYGYNEIIVGRSKPIAGYPKIREWSGVKRDVTHSATHCVAMMMNEYARAQNLETTSYDFDEGTLYFKPKYDSKKSNEENKG